MAGTDTQAILRHWQDAVPDDRLAHLIRDAGRSLGHRLAPLLAEHDIPFGHWVFLRVLWDRDGLTQKELSDAVGVTEPTTFAAVKALIAKGYITRRHNPGNKRKFYVYLTPEGAALRDVLPLPAGGSRLLFSSDRHGGSATALLRAARDEPCSVVLVT